MRKKDVVLMATVSSFESLQFPTKSELRQFAELFAPLFKASSDEAKRQAVAALSQYQHVPEAVALFIGSQPIGISAIFLTCSQCISDDTLITIARTQGGAHSKAIARRENLSPTVIDALVGVRQEWPGRGALDAARPAAPAADMPRIPVAPPLAAASVAQAPSVEPEQPVLPVAEVPLIAGPPVLEAESRADQAAAPPTTAPIEAQSSDENYLPPAWAVTEDTVAAPPAASKEENVRQELRELIRQMAPSGSDRLGLRTLNETQEALLVRFARSREADHFATTLADALSTSRWLAERIMLDISGLQLATTLVSLGANDEDSAFILIRLYPHLAERDGETTRATALLDGLDPNECDMRVEAWRRADSYTFRPDRAATDSADAGRNRPTLVRPDRDLRLVGRR